MKQNKNTGSKILKPSVIHDDLPEITKIVHKGIVDDGNDIPENPERNYHHKELRSISKRNNEINNADDDVWNGEDA